MCRLWIASCSYQALSSVYATDEQKAMKPSPSPAATGILSNEALAHMRIAIDGGNRVQGSMVLKLINEIEGLRKQLTPSKSDVEAAREFLSEQPIDYLGTTQPIMEKELAALLTTRRTLGDTGALTPAEVEGAIKSALCQFPTAKKYALESVRALIAASRETRALTEEERALVKQIENYADRERDGGILKSYIRRLRKIISRLTGETSA